jgi:hypothetical protein
MEYTSTDDYLKALWHVAKEKIYIVGAGKYGVILGKYFDKYKIPWEGYVDKRTDFHQVNGKPVYTYKEITDGYFIVSSYIYKAEIIKELERCGFNLNHAICYENQGIFYDLFEDLINFRENQKKIRLFYKKHCGKRCFIVGNGPSLRIEDLEKLKKEYTFAANSIYALYMLTEWRPIYYCASDSIFCRQMMSDKRNMKMLMDGCRAAFTSMMGEGIDYRNDDDLRNLHFMRLLKKEAECQLPYFSSDCSRRVYTAGTITYEMLQLAVYMGFQEIYLLGMDFSYSVERHNDNSITKNGVCNHMKEIEWEEQKFYKAISKKYNESYMADIDLQLAGYKAAKEYVDSHGIEIYNATRGGKLEVFPRVNFDDLFI